MPYILPILSLIRVYCNILVCIHVASLDKTLSGTESYPPLYSQHLHSAWKIIRAQSFFSGVNKWQLYREQLNQSTSWLNRKVMVQTVRGLRGSEKRKIHAYRSIREDFIVVWSQTLTQKENLIWQQEKRYRSKSQSKRTCKEHDVCVVH